MYYSRFKGNHYEIGYKWGDMLFKNGKNILEKIPFPLTEKHFDFSKKSLPYYEKFFPEILEEIKGIADGQKCPYEKLYSFLISMYSIIPTVSCSCFAVKNGKNIIFGRNSDFLKKLKKESMNCIYKFEDNGYSFTGNTTAFIEMEDGINEHGLSVGLTSVYPSVIKEGLNAGMILRLFLEKCKNVKEALDIIQTIPIASSQTFILTDISGDIALIECNSEKTIIKNPKEENIFLSSVNKFFTEEMQKYNLKDIDNWQSDERYKTIENILNLKAHTFDLENSINLLSGKNGFICQYDKKGEKDTIWSVIYDLKNKEIYRAEGNPSRKSFIKDKKFFIK